MSVLSNFFKSLACWRSPGGGGYQVYGSSSCPAMGKFRNCALCVGLVLISLVLITSYYMGDNEYRQKLSEIKHPPHARVRRPEGCGYQVSGRCWAGRGGEGRGGVWLPVEWAVLGGEGRGGEMYSYRNAIETILNHFHFQKSTIDTKIVRSDFMTRKLYIFH